MGTGWGAKTKVEFRHGRDIVITKVALWPLGPGEPAILSNGLICKGRSEGGVLVGTMVGDKIENDSQSFLVGTVNQLHQVRLRAKTRFDLGVVTAVITVMRRTAENGGEPDGIESEIVDMIQFFDNTPQRAAKGLEQIFGLQPVAV